MTKMQEKLNREQELLTSQARRAIGCIEELQPLELNIEQVGHSGLHDIAKGYLEQRLAWIRLAADERRIDVKFIVEQIDKIDERLDKIVEMATMYRCTIADRHEQ